MGESVTVLIPSLGRPELVRSIMGRLRVQNYKNFDVLLIMAEPTPDITRIANEYRNSLNLRVIFQKRPGFLEAYNEGLDKATGDLVLFTDDDALPEPDWIAQHVAIYEAFRVSGVSGDVISVHLRNGVIEFTQRSEVVFCKELKNRSLFWLYNFVSRSALNRPLRGLEQYYYYISRSGYAEINYDIDLSRVVDSLPCMGVNMSVRRSAVYNFRFPLAIHKRGAECERILGWYLWKRGHRTVFNKAIKTYHLLHDEDTLSRCTDRKNVEQNRKERELMFYYFAIQKEKVSLTYHLVCFVFNFLIGLRGYRRNSWCSLPVLSGMIIGNLEGLTMMISCKLGGKYKICGR